MVKKPGAKSWSMHVLFPYFQANLRLSHSGVSSTVLLPPSPVYTLAQLAVVKKCLHCRLQYKYSKQTSLPYKQKKTNSHYNLIFNILFTNPEVKTEDETGKRN